MRVLNGEEGINKKARKLTERERWFLIGSLSYALSKSVGFELSLSGFRDFEITDFVINRVQDIIVRNFGEPPLTEEELRDIANTMQVTNFIADKVEKDAYDGR